MAVVVPCAHMECEAKLGMRGVYKTTEKFD